MGTGDLPPVTYNTVGLCVNLTYAPSPFTTNLTGSATCGVRAAHEHTNLPSGRLCDQIAGKLPAKRCNGNSVTLDTLRGYIASISNDTACCIKARSAYAV